MKVRLLLAAALLAASATTASAALADTPFVAVPPDAPNFPRPMPAKIVAVDFWQVLEDLFRPKLGVALPPLDWI